MSVRPGAVSRWCLLCLALAAPLLAGAAPDEQSVRDSQREAQERRKELQQRIRNVQQELELREAERKDAADALKQSERALSDINRRLHELAAQERAQQAELARLERETAAQQSDLDRRRAELAGQLREQYANELSPWSVWLSGGDPQDNGRNLAYLDYVARARAETVRGLDTEIARLEAMQAEQRAGRERLAALNDEAEAQQRLRETQQKERAGVLARLEDKIRRQKVEASRLSQDDERLGTLVSDLGRQLEVARREAEARRQAELKRQAELRQARERAEAERAARQAAARAAAEKAAAEKVAAERAVAAAAARAAKERERALAASEARAAAGPVSSLRQVEGPRLSAGEASGQTPAPMEQARVLRQDEVATVDVRPTEPDPRIAIEAEARAAAAQAAAREAEAREAVRVAEAREIAAREAAREAEAQEAAAREEAARQAVARDNAAAEATARENAARRQAVATGGGQGPAGGTNGLRSGLRPPLVGQVLARFGTERPDGGAWRGQLIAAPEGTAVRVVESGTVVYANWLRGFGNIIIVDHGRDYLSVYAHNQSLLKQVGDAVARQEAIALAGATGGQVDSGLYFEVRHRGTPVDPSRFIGR